MTTPYRTSRLRSTRSNPHPWFEQSLPGGYSPAASQVAECFCRAGSEPAADTDVPEVTVLKRPAAGGVEVRRTFRSWM